jgi:membrane protein
MTLKEARELFTDAGKSFMRDDAFTLAGSLAFYAALSLAPLVVLLLWAASWLGPDTRQRMLEQLQQTAGGAEGGEGITMIVENAQQQPGLGTFAGIISLVMLAFAATGAFAQLQHIMNLIWDVKAKPGQGVSGVLRRRLLALLLIVALGVLLIASIVFSAIVSGVISQMADAAPGGQVVWTVLNFLAPLVVFIPMFAVIFKYLPDVQIAWRDVWIGAVVTGIMFEVGNQLIGLYLAYGGATSAYGAAGSLIALLLWAYYSSLILFFGAELTQVWARMSGRRIEPAENAERYEHVKPIGDLKTA